MSKKLGLALGSGGVRGVAHVGFLLALEEEGVTADYVTGCSMGAIVGTLYCAGVPAAEIKERMLGLKLTSIAAPNLFPLRANGMMRLTRAKKLLRGIIGDITFEQLKIPFGCVAVDLAAGELKFLSRGSVIDAAIASGSMPGVFTPSVYEGRKYVDGGILERVPVKELTKMGAERVVAVDVLGDLTRKPVTDNLIGTLLRCVDVVDTRATERKRKRAENVDLWLEPALGEMDQYRVKKGNMLIACERGYELGKANVRKIKKLIG